MDTSSVRDASRCFLLFDFVYEFRQPVGDRTDLISAIYSSTIFVAHSHCGRSAPCDPKSIKYHTKITRLVQEPTVGSLCPRSFVIVRNIVVKGEWYEQCRLHRRRRWWNKPIHELGQEALKCFSLPIVPRSYLSKKHAAGSASVIKIKPRDDINPAVFQRLGKAWRDCLDHLMTSEPGHCGAQSGEKSRLIRAGKAEPNRVPLKIAAYSQATRDLK